jgi:hypothetical protein
VTIPTSDPNEANIDVSVDTALVVAVKVSQTQLGPVLFVSKTRIPRYLTDLVERVKLALSFLVLQREQTRRTLRA